MARAKTPENLTKIICCKCGSKTQSNFYSTKDPSRSYYGKIVYCKDCVREFYNNYLKKYNNNTNLAIYYLCRKIDIPYVHSAYLGAVENIQNPNSKIQGEANLLSAYIKNLSFADSNGWGNSFDDSQGVDLIEGLQDYDVYLSIKKKKKNNLIDNDEEEYDLIEYKTEDLIRKWGVKSEEDLIRLESEYLDWKDKLGGQIDEKSIEIIVMQICYQTLEIAADRDAGLDVGKKLSVLTALMNNAGLLEKQRKAKEDNLSVGQRIEDIERRHPIKKVDPELSDVDNLRVLITTFIAGVSRALGKTNKYTEEFTKDYAPYNISIIEGDNNE